MRRLLVFAAAALSAGAGAYAASAAGLVPFTSGQVAAANETILACDSDGFSVSYTTSGGNVTAATVGGIADPGCEGGELLLTLTDAADASIAAGGPQAIPADGDASPNSVVVSLTPQPAAELVAGYRIVLTGP